MPNGYEWFRLYHEIIFDPKVRQLSSNVRWLWVTCLCLASMSRQRGWIIGYTPEGIKDAAAVDTDIEVALATLIGLKMLMRVKRGWKVMNWNRWQYDHPSDHPEAVLQRVRKHRAKRQRNDRETLHGNDRETTVKHPRVKSRVDTDLDTDTDKERTTSFADAHAKLASAVRLDNGHFSISPDVLSTWTTAYPAIDVSREVSAAYAWVQANPKNRKSNWQRFLVNWLKRAQDNAPARGGGVAPTKQEPELSPALKRIWEGTHHGTDRDES